ncbi:MAG: hypothetical protein AAF291_09455 [Pseudomonadota bacterium]
MTKSAPQTPRKDRVTRTLDEESVAQRAEPRRLLPSPDATTNLLIADIIVRSASTLFRQGVERRVAKASVAEPEEAEALLDGQTMIKSLALYGASKLATRSPLGLGLVAGGLAVKTLYDRGKARRKRLARPVPAKPGDA